MEDGEKSYSNPDLSVVNLNIHQMKFYIFFSVYMSISLNIYILNIFGDNIK